MIKDFLSRLFGFTPQEEPAATSSRTTEPDALYTSPSPDIELDNNGQFTKCPAHGRKHLYRCGFNEHSGHADGTHGHTIWLHCTVKGCLTVVPDSMDYYERVHPEQLAADKEFAREVGGELWLPGYLMGQGPEGEGYRQQASTAEINPRNGQPYLDPPPRPSAGLPPVPVRE